MKLSLLNGSSYLALGSLKKILESNKYSNIKLLDLFGNNCRYSRVYRVLDSVDTNTKIEFIKYSDDFNLKNGIKGSDHLLYFTHDYASLAPCKNEIYEKAFNLKNNFEYVL